MGKERILHALCLMDTSICHNKTLILMAAKLWDLSKMLNKMAANISGFTVISEGRAWYVTPFFLLYGR